MAQVRIKDIPQATEVVDSDNFVIDQNAETFSITAAQLKEYIGSNGGGVAIGTIAMWGSTVSLPIGFLRCEGQNVLRADYPELFDIIGLTYSPIDDGTSFWLPDYQGLVARGAGTQTVNGRSKDGGALGEALEDQIQSHAHIQEYNASDGNTLETRNGAEPVTSANRRWAFRDTGSSSGYAPKTSLPIGSARIGDETRVSTLGTIFIIKAENLETATASESAIDSLNARVSNLESSLLVLANKAITTDNIGDILKAGRFSYNSDGNYTVYFDTAFSAGVDSDIEVVLLRHGGNLQSAQGVTNITKSSFDTDRENGVDGEQTYSYIAINKHWLNL